PPAPTNADPTRNAGLASANLPAVPTLASVKDQLNGFFKSTTETFASITDASSADAALPKLQDLTRKLDGISGAVNALPPDAKAQVTSQFQSLLATLKPKIDQAMAIPGISDRIKPVVDQLLSKFDSLAGH